MTALREERKKEEKRKRDSRKVKEREKNKSKVKKRPSKDKGNEHPMKQVHPKEFLSLTMTLSLTCPHLVLSRKEIIAGIHLSSAIRLLTEVFPGLLLPLLSCPCDPSLKPFLPL